MNIRDAHHQSIVRLLFVEEEEEEATDCSGDIRGQSFATAEENDHRKNNLKISHEIITQSKVRQLIIFDIFIRC